MSVAAPQRLKQLQGAADIKYRIMYFILWLKLLRTYVPALIVYFAHMRQSLNPYNNVSSPPTFDKVIDSNASCSCLEENVNFSLIWIGIRLDIYD